MIIDHTRTYTLPNGEIITSSKGAYWVAENLIEEPKHFDYLSWNNDGMYFNVVTQEWSLEPHGHEHQWVPTVEDAKVELRRLIEVCQSKMGKFVHIRRNRKLMEIYQDRLDGLEL
jgi:hypothetical protein